MREILVPPPTVNHKIFGQVYENEGLVGRRTRVGGYYTFYTSKRITGDISSFKKYKGVWTQIGSISMGLHGRQNIIMDITGSTIKTGLKSYPICITDTDLVYGLPGHVISRARVSKYNIPIVRKKL